MHSQTDLFWLPKHPSFPSALKDLQNWGDESISVWLEQASQLARHCFNFLEESKLDRTVQKKIRNHDPQDAMFGKTIRIACLAESTVDHLIPSLRIAGLRRGLIFDCYVSPYGQIHQDVFSPSSDLKAFRPDVVLVALSSAAAAAPLSPSLTHHDVETLASGKIDDLKNIWRIINEDIGATVIQQTLAPTLPSLYGHFDKAVPSSPRAYQSSFNLALLKAAYDQSCAVLDLDQIFMKHGAENLHNPVLWHHAKQELSPQIAPLWADHVGRTVQALVGLSKKCLVLDLDNTLWGGVIGDDGLNGITLGMGSAAGESFCAFQRYVKMLNQRGILLAVCSKNTHKIAFHAINNHPEMVLSTDDFSAFKANWDGKPGNLQTIADELNIGLNSLVFFDDNPVERDHVRTTLPMVMVPEVPSDPALYVNCLESAGYFDTVSLTDDDLHRAAQYKANALRHTDVQKTGNMSEYLASLDMQILISRFQSIDLKRITQLVNKTNQFNLTTRKYAQTQLEQLADDKTALAISARLKDKYGDNGLISVIIAKQIVQDNKSVMVIDTWLMSCRVLGRMVENELFNYLVNYAKMNGIETIIGDYIPTDRNGLVSDLYEKLGFSACPLDTSSSTKRFVFEVTPNTPKFETPITFQNV